MRITHLIIGLGDGGAEKSLYKIVIGDDSHRHSVISLTSEGKYGPLLADKGIAVRFVRWQSLRPISSIFRLVRALRMSRPDIIHGWMPHGALAASLLKRWAGARKVIWSVRSSDYGSARNPFLTKIIVKLLAQMSNSVPSRILVVGHRALERHKEMGFSVEKMVCVQNGYQARRPEKWSHVSHDSETHSSALGGAVVKFGMVARYHPKKGHSALLEAFARLEIPGPDWTLTLVGEAMTEDNQELARDIVRLGLTDRVILMGPVIDPEDFYESLDFHVLPSVSEGFPNVVAESMLAGVPNIVTEVGDSALIVGDTGWVVPPNDTSALTEAIQSALASEPLERLRRGLRANERIRQCFSYDRMLQSHQSEYARRTVVAYPRYSRLGASSRVRMFQYADALTNMGWEVRFFPFSNSKFLLSRYMGRNAWLSVLLSYIRRFRHLSHARDADLVWIQRELIPWAPAWFEMLLTPKRAPVIYDFDDAVHEQFRENRRKITRIFLGEKTAQTVDNAFGVVVGNKILADFFSRKTGSKQVLIPSVIDETKLYPARNKFRDEGRPFVFGWIGTPLTFDTYLAGLVNEFESIAKELKAEFWIIGSSSDERSTDNLRFFRWNEKTENRLLNSIDVGVMPLKDDAWARGKCGYKLLQYMAVAKPVLASPVGVNVEIVSHGKTGFLVQEPDDWARYLRILAGDRKLAYSMGQRAKKEVHRSYSLTSSAPRMADFFAEVAGARSVNPTASDLS